MANFDVMLAKVGSRDTLKNKKFIFEPKFDGTRVLIYKKGKNITLVNRRNKNITKRYPELESIWKDIKEDCVLDGELVVLGENHLPNFNLLQKREQIENKTQIKLRSIEIPATIFVFDILQFKGKNLTKLPLLKRKEFLSKVIKNSSNISLTPYTKNGEALWKQAEKLSLEGVMAKNPKSEYYEGKRTNDWLKIKNTKTLDAIIIGYTREKREISSLVLAAYHKKKLVYIGRVGAGLNERIIEDFIKKFKETKKPAVKFKTHKKIYYVMPEIIAEIKYLEISKDEKLRAPVFLRIRDDKKLKDCVI